jgi:hypothetical protein
MFAADDDGIYFEPVARGVDKPGNRVFVYGVSCSKKG